MKSCQRAPGGGDIINGWWLTGQRAGASAQAQMFRWVEAPRGVSDWPGWVQLLRSCLKSPVGRRNRASTLPCRPFQSGRSSTPSESACRIWLKEVETEEKLVCASLTKFYRSGQNHINYYRLLYNNFSNHALPISGNLSFLNNLENKIQSPSINC